MDAYEEKKAEILLAAKKYIGKYGIKKTTLEEIAASVGMKKNSLYYYFKNKEALLDEIMREKSKLILEVVKKSLPGSKSESEKVLKFIDNTIGAHEEMASELKLSLSAFIEILAEIHKTYSHIREEMIRTLGDILKTGIKNKEFKKHNHNYLAQSLLEMAGALQMQEFLRSGVEFIDEVDLKEGRDRTLLLTKLVLDGIKNS